MNLAWGDRLVARAARPFSEYVATRSGVVVKPLLARRQI